MKIDLTREEMVDRLIEETYDGWTRTFWSYFEYYQQREYADWTTEQIEQEYKEYFSYEQESERS